MSTAPPGRPRGCSTGGSSASGEIPPGSIGLGFAVAVAPTPPPTACLASSNMGGFRRARLARRVALKHTPSSDPSYHRPAPKLPAWIKAAEDEWVSRSSWTSFTVQSPTAAAGIHTESAGIWSDEGKKRDYQEAVARMKRELKSNAIRSYAVDKVIQEIIDDALTLVERKRQQQQDREQSSPDTEVSDVTAREPEESRCASRDSGSPVNEEATTFNFVMSHPVHEQGGPVRFAGIYPAGHCCSASGGASPSSVVASDLKGDQTEAGIIQMHATTTKIMREAASKERAAVEALTDSSERVPESQAHVLERERQQLEMAHVNATTNHRVAVTAPPPRKHRAAPLLISQTPRVAIQSKQAQAAATAAALAAVTPAQRFRSRRAEPMRYGAIGRPGIPRYVALSLLSGPPLQLNSCSLPNVTSMLSSSLVGVDIDPNGGKQLRELYNEMSARHLPHRHEVEQHWRAGQRTERGRYALETDLRQARDALRADSHGARNHIFGFGMERSWRRAPVL